MENGDIIRSIIRVRKSFDLLAVGGSMQPSIVSGDTIRLVSPDRLEVGSIIAYPGERSHRPVLHRVSLISDGSVCVVGDSSRRQTVCCCEEVIGMASSIRPKGSDCYFSIAEIGGLSREIAEVSQLVTRDGFLSADDRDELLLRRERLCTQWRQLVLRGERFAAGS